jgi:SAM-dependent methyltransferase
LKLHLGCGARLLDGYTNVDVIDKGQELVHSLRHLPFEDAVADEILSVHVIEHFHIQEVSAVLDEWYRVLKPGGRIILECPDLAKILENFRAKRTMRLTMLGLYGNVLDDPSPYMLHKWCWTGPSLCLALEKAGFVDATVKEPQYHFPARDMRVEAVKSDKGA